MDDKGASWRPGALHRDVHIPLIVVYTRTALAVVLVSDVFALSQTRKTLSVAASETWEE